MLVGPSFTAGQGQAATLVVTVVDCSLYFFPFLVSW